MKMNVRIIPGILLMLSLGAALLATGNPSVAVADDVSAILLPSQGQDQAVTAAPKRPWKCCDNALCTRSIPPICTCVDKVERCAPTCKTCVRSRDDPSRRVCKDQYVGKPGPICRPWKCCDLPLCTRSNPPTCQCLDEVNRCAPTCKTCLPSRPRPSRRVCNDRYLGPIPPKCTPRQDVAAGGD